MAMKQLLFPFILLLLGCSSESQEVVQPLAVEVEPEEGTMPSGVQNISYEMQEVPAGATYEGAIQHMATWEDKQGHHVLLLTRANDQLVESTEWGDDVFEAHLYGYHYVLKEGEAELVWDIHDFVKECPFDLWLEFVKQSLKITDVDKNGIAESVFMYKLACTSDVSPPDLKLMMHEGEVKYAIRGEAQIDYGNGTVAGGEGTADPAFDNAPETFLDHAWKTWETFKTDAY